MVAKQQGVVNRRFLKTNATFIDFHLLAFENFIFKEAMEVVYFLLDFVN